VLIAQRESQPGALVLLEQLAPQGLAISIVTYKVPSRFWGTRSSSVLTRVVSVRGLEPWRWPLRPGCPLVALRPHMGGHLRVQDGLHGPLHQPPLERRIITQRHLRRRGQPPPIALGHRLPPRSRFLTRGYRGGRWPSHPRASHSQCIELYGRDPIEIFEREWFLGYL
jgi:hypothetical protein